MEGLNVPKSTEIVETSSDDEELTPEVLERRKDWEENNLRIRDVYMKFLADKKFGRPPTIAEIVEETKLSEKAVRNHLKELSFADLREEEKRKAAPLLGDVIAGMALSARKGNAKSQELFMSIFGEVFVKRNELAGPGGSNLFEGMNVNTINAFIARKSDNEHVARALSELNRGSGSSESDE